MKRIISIPEGSPTILAPNGRLGMLEAAENNWYEGSRWSPNRSYIWFPVQDPKKDLDRFTRTELSKSSRYLYKNSPLICGMIERMVTLICGSGYVPSWKTPNEDWNKRAKAAYMLKSRNIHLGPKCSMSQYQRAVVRAKLVDGEGFSVKTFNERLFENRIQGLEADRIQGLADKQASKETADFRHTGIVDGFNLDEQGEVASYNIRGVDTPYDSENVVHHFTPQRLGQYRGVTILASAINTARDIDDILALEKECVKEASSHKDIIETPSGQLDPEAFRQMRYGQNGYPTVFNLPTDSNTKDDYYRVAFGAQPVVLRKGDKYTPYIPNRPGTAWQGFMEFLSNTTGSSTGFPISVLFPINIGGTDIRRDLDIAQRVVEPYQLDLAAELDELVEYLLLPEIQEGSLRQGYEPGFLQCRTWQFPMKINVDRAQAAADRDDVARGLMSREEYHGRYGDDVVTVDETVIAEAKRRKSAIQSAGFTETKEFVEVLSLDSKMFMTRSQDDEVLATGKTPKPQPTTK